VRPTCGAIAQWGVLAAWIGASIYATFDAWRDIASAGWNDEESSHVLLAPMVFAWIFWVRRRRMAKLVVHARWVGLLIMAVAAALWFVGLRDRIHTAWQLGGVLMVVGGAVVALGTGFVWRFLPAFGSLIFLIPMSGGRRQAFAAPMQLITAKLTQNVCELFGMIVDRQGSLLSCNGVSVAIAEACNGMRMVLTLVIVSYLYAFITPLRGYVRVLIIVFSPVTAIVCNVIRLVPTVWMFAHTSKPTAEMFHDISGWAMLLVGFLLVMGVIRLLRWIGLPVDAVAPEPRLPEALA
jgi:exosortase